MTMEIELNGWSYQIDEGQTVGDLIASLSLQNDALAVAINREIVPRGIWSQWCLQAADQVDIVRPIGGG